MFKKEIGCKKVIAACLIFCFLFANTFTIFTNISYAKSNELGKQTSQNTSNNVSFDASFVKAEENQGYEYEGTIDEENLGIQLQVEVKKEGYLKNAHILIESENGLSFEIAQEIGEKYKVEGNKISLSNISSGEKTNFILPIKYKESEQIDNLNKKINIKLIGTYITNSGEEQNISENIITRLIWNTNTEFNITSELKKYIPYESESNQGIIAQTSVKSWIPEKNSFVTKEELEIEAMKIEGYTIEKVAISNKTGERLPDDAWNFDKENEKINIKFEKTNESIKTNEFLITYVFSGENNIEKPFKINSKINGSIFMFGTNEQSDYELNAEYEVIEEIGSIVSIESEAQENLKYGNILTNSLSEENNYTSSYENTIKLDISLAEMIQNLEIKDESEEFENESEKVAMNSSKIKIVSIEKENFEDMLSENGKIEILNSQNEVIATIEKDNYIANIDESNITIKTSKPVKEGILVIKTTKEIGKTDYSYEELKTFSTLNTKYSGICIYDQNVENIIGNAESKIKLEKPTTNAELTISRKTLSTISENKDIELDIKFNNNNEDNDLYKNPEFQLTFPEYIENVDVTNIAIANAEEVFEIENATINKNEEGKNILNIKLSGEQTTYNTNNITNGTNLIINANLTLDLYAPSKTENIILEYINEDATSYKNQTEKGLGTSNTKIEIKAPVGMVSINKTSNYEDTGKSITSVEQGIVTDKIEIFDEEKIATMDLIIMNNNENLCNDVKILGRIPFKGNKDFETGKDLGTTIDTTLYGNIYQSENNKVLSTIYYSENENATEDLNNLENGWTTNIEELEKVKSYLIIPEEYEMQSGDVLEYSYQYEIPSNLEHNTDIYSSFETVYNNVSDLATVSEVSTADIVGLTTGIGPQISVETKTNMQGSIKEYEKVKYTITVENTGTDVAENVEVTTKVPQWSTLATHLSAETVEGSKGWTLKPDREIKTIIEKLEPSETKYIEFYVQANKLPTIEEYYANEEGFAKNEDGTYSLNTSYVDDKGETKYEEKIIDSLPEIKLVCESTITATDLAKEITTKNDEITVTKSNLVAEETVETEETIARVNETIEAKIQIKNNSQEKMKNIKVTKVLPKELNYSETYIRGYESDGITLKKIKSTTYDEASRTITWTIDELDAGRTIVLIGDFVVAKMEEGIYEKTFSTISNIEVSGEKYQAGQVDITAGRPNIEITQTSNKTNQYIKVGDEIEYIFNIKNTGPVRANNISFVDELPSEVSIKKLEYVIDGIEVSKVVAKNEDATIYTNILPSGTLEAKITAEVNNIQERQKTIINTANIEGEEIETLQSNQVVNIIEKTSQSIEETESENNEDNQNNNQENNNIKTTYEIKGIVWLEKEKDGKRDNSESKISGIEVKLINAETGKMIDKTTTSSDGEYKFDNLSNGKYNVIFYYNSSKYGITEYRKQGVAENLNSDVILGKEGNTLAAITDVITIENGSKSNIDMGLIEANIFDLSLSKRITKVTVQNSSGTKSYDFNSTDLAKVDINAKYLNGSNVIVEYAITVANEGEIEGYAKKIVDYMPEELEFSTELNKSWYKGNDGNLYTEALADTPIAANESQTVKLVLTKSMTDTNTGIINNQAEIAEDYNKAGISDLNSQPNDKDPKDNDISSADLIIGVKTGETLIYISIAITIILAGIIIVITINKSKIIYKIQARFGKEV